MDICSVRPVESSLPSEVRRTSESGFVGLKHSVKASIGLCHLP